MKLRRVRVRHFRSIVDSEPVDLEERVTVLIGKNEQGKTTFLRALASLNDGVTYTPKDLPNHLRADLEKRSPADIPIVDAWLTPDGDELSALLVDIAPQIDQISNGQPHTEPMGDTRRGLPDFLGMHITKYYDSHYTYALVRSDSSEQALEPMAPDISPYVRAITQEAETLRLKLKTHAERLPAFAPSLEQAGTHIDALAGANFAEHEQIVNLLKTFATALKGLPGQDLAIQEDIAQTLAAANRANETLQQALRRDIYAPVRRAIPRLVFHSTSVDHVPDFVGIADFVATPDTVSKGMANLCAVAGLSVQKIKQLASTTDAPERETFEDHYRATISGGINEFWTQEHYTVHFRIETTRLSVSVSDGTYASRIPPSDRSDGFQWYLSFYAALLSEVSAIDPMVLLLDNPGLELHATGQQDIKRFLEEKLPSTAQVVYVTHSSAMIDAHRLEQVRQVELHREFRGTKVAKMAVKDGAGFDLLEPVRSALGATLASSLICNELNVLVEGAADKPILEAAVKIALPAEMSRIVINGSIAENNGLLPRFYQQGRLPFIVFLDADSAGREMKGRLRGWGLANEVIISLGDIFHERSDDFELEDILSTAFYHTAVSSSYPEQTVDTPDPHTGKRTRQYEVAFREKFKVGFNKRRVAENVKRLLGDGQGDAESVDNLKRLGQAVWEALQGQVTGPRAPAAG